MFKLAAGADDGALAVALDNSGIATKGGDELARHGKAEGLQIVHEGNDVGVVTTGEGIVDHRQDSGAALGPRRRRTVLVEDFLDTGEEAADPDLSHWRQASARHGRARRRQSACGRQGGGRRRRSRPTP